MDSRRFLREYWQQRPLLMRQALPGYVCPLSADELAGLSCEAEIESRLVLEKGGERPWEARHGPFDDETFGNLPATHWTLLLQDMDKHCAPVAQLLEPFRFAPDWRVDDIMISYAPDQGSVGPHIDDYDVFLVQGYGKRRWRVHTQPVEESDYIDGLDLRILPHFTAEYDWLLEPGDVLYLPPNVAHWGVAEGECITCSVGFRAPLLHDLARAWTEHLIDRRIPSGRYRDPAIQPQDNSGEILDAVVARLHKDLRALQNDESDAFRLWLGGYLTETKENLMATPPDETLTSAEFLAALEQFGEIERSGYARMAFCRGQNGIDHLFVNGEALALSSEHDGFLPLLTEQRQYAIDELAHWLAFEECLQLLCNLYNEGYVEFPDYEDDV
jgi:50S ribosomal protein L16 3-hydroxylase